MQDILHCVQDIKYHSKLVYISKVIGTFQEKMRLARLEFHML